MWLKCGAPLGGFHFGFCYGSKLWTQKVFKNVFCYGVESKDLLSSDHFVFITFGTKL